MEEKAARFAHHAMSRTRHGTPKSSPKNNAKVEGKSQNESPVDLTPKELTPYVRVVQPSRASLTYDRME